METYNFWYETYAGYTFEEKRLTKRMAVIRFNRLEKNYNPSIKSFGWKLERKPIDLNKLMENYAQV
jgi:hypothetical protein